MSLHGAFNFWNHGSHVRAKSFSTMVDWLRSVVGQVRINPSEVLTNGPLPSISSPTKCIYSKAFCLKIHTSNRWPIAHHIFFHQSLCVSSNSILMSDHHNDSKSGNAPRSESLLSRFSLFFICPCLRLSRGKPRSSQPNGSSPVTSDITLDNSGCKKGTTSRRQAESIVRDLCITYLNSFPGIPNRSSNTAVQALAHSLINGENLTRWAIEELRLTLLHRLNLMKWATGFKNFLGLDFPDCDRFDVDEWELAVAKRSGQDTTKYDLFDQCRGKIRHAQIFPLPPTHSNHGHILSLSYPKGTEYLAAVFAESGFSLLQIDEALARLADCKDPSSGSFSPMVRTLTSR